MYRIFCLFVFYLRKSFGIFDPFDTVRFQALPDLQGGCANLSHSLNPR